VRDPADSRKRRRKEVRRFASLPEATPYSFFSFWSPTHPRASAFPVYFSCSWGLALYREPPLFGGGVGSSGFTPK
jgi:hypothetical protein